MFYDGIKAEFIPIYYEMNEKSDDMGLVRLIIQKNNFKGPYGIDIGDNAESIFEFFPVYKEDYLKNTLGLDTVDFYEPNTKLIYISRDKEDIGLVAYDDSGKIIRVEYSENYETGGVISIKFEISKDKIYEISIYEGYR